jgi:heme exporter protein C
MHADMFQPLVVMIAGFYCFYALAVLLSLRSEILEREEKSRWVEELATTGKVSA